MSNKMNKRTLANYYRKAAKVIDKQKTLVKSELKTLEGTYCAIGALMHVQGCEPIAGTSLANVDDIERDLLSEGVATGFIEKLHGPGPNSMAYNDLYASTYKEVARQLRTTARAIEHGGKL